MFAVLLGPLGARKVGTHVGRELTVGRVIDGFDSYDACLKRGFLLVHVPEKM